MSNQALEKLHHLAIQESEIANRSPEHVFDDIGLNLWDISRAFRYTTTPLNSSTFAYTGGDGVHFSLLHIRGQVTDDSPVVMSSPADSYHPNIILGSNLLDFLSLGCEIGYSAIEEFACQYEQAIQWVKNPIYWHIAAGHTPNDRHFRIEQRQTYLIRKEFSLSPWRDVEKHLFDLQTKFLPWLEPHPDFSKLYNWLA